MYVTVKYVTAQTQWTLLFWTSYFAKGNIQLRLRFQFHVDRNMMNVCELLQVPHRDTGPVTTRRVY